MEIEFAWAYVICGAVGGLASVLLTGDGIELPKTKDGKLYLGSGLTGIVLGGIAGMVGDSNWYNAFFWGMGGGHILKGILSKFVPVEPEVKDGK